MNYWANEEIYVELKDNKVIVTHENGDTFLLPANKDAKPYRALLNQDSEFFIELFETEED